MPAIPDRPNTARLNTARPSTARLPKVAIPACLMVLSLAACAPREEMRDAVDDRAPPVRVVGEAQSCIPITQIRNSEVHSDYTIDFHAGNRTWRNTLPNRCAALGNTRAFSYSTSLNQLCSTDIITVIEPGSPMLTRGSCGLGQFVPVERVEDAAE